MKKVVRLTESDLERIIKKVISEQMASGVAFGNEGNGFKMKREPKEQQTPQKEARKITTGWMVPTVQDLESSAKKVFGELTGTLPGQTSTPSFTEFIKRDALDKGQLQQLVNGAINLAYQKVRALKLPLYQMSDYYTKMCNTGKGFCYSYTEGNESEKNQALEVGSRQAYGKAQQAAFEMLRKMGLKNNIQDLNIGGDSVGALVF
jgi:hypothetical protein